MPTLFFSYSHKDEALRDELEVHLTSLKRQGLIDTWHDRRIIAGEEWDAKISENLETAEVILLLVSPDFIASDYCFGRELERALERHQQGNARVIPVILRPCSWQELSFGKLQATPEDGRPVTKFPDRDEAFLRVTEDIRRAVESISGPVQAAAAPAPKAGAPARPDAEPRSSNLRVRKEFSQRDRDRFLTDTFEFVARFFENSLAELEQRHDPIDTNFRRVDANTFDSAIYRVGEIAARCRIWVAEGGTFPRGILYSSEGGGSFGGSTSFNEQLSVESDDQKLFLKPLGLRSGLGRGENQHLSQQGAAEYLWNMLVEGLQ